MNSRRDMDLAIVTIAFGGYGEWLPKWAEHVSVVGPTQTVIALGQDHGLTAKDEAVVLKFLPDVHIVRTNFRTMGALRNAAVEETRTEWVLYLSSDDGIYPDALETLAASATDSDFIIVSWDSVRTYIPNDTVQHHHALLPTEMVGGRGFIVGHSPFTRRLWERVGGYVTHDLPNSPFNTACARAGARFTKTTKPVTIYLRRPDSHCRLLRARAQLIPALSAQAKELAKEQTETMCHLYGDKGPVT